MDQVIKTRQVNLKLTSAHEDLVRLLVQRLRVGGIEYESRVRDFLMEAPAPRYMHVTELERRFGSIDRRLERLEERLRLAGLPNLPEEEETTDHAIAEGSHTPATDR